jgi:hypothetical protein
MAITINPQKQKNSKQRQEQSEFKRRSLGDVRQDNNAHPRDSIPSTQPYRTGQSARSRTLSINSDRSKKRLASGTGGSITCWVEKPIRAAIYNIARRSGLTRSKTIALLIEWVLIEHLLQECKNRPDFQITPEMEEFIAAVVIARQKEDPDERGMG